MRVPQIDWFIRNERAEKIIQAPSSPFQPMDRKIPETSNLGKFRIQGPTKLCGEVKVSGAKNAALPILFTVLLTEEPVLIQNVPEIKDIDIAIKILREIGVLVKWNGSSIYLNASGVDVYCTSKELASTIRHSICALGPLIARFGQAQIPLPGGCAIGSRPVDLHITGLKQLGAKLELSNGWIKGSVGIFCSEFHGLETPIN